MTTFSEKTGLHEILIRVSSDGSFASQYQTINEVLKDGVVISATLGDVMPLLKEDAQSFAIVKEFLGETVAVTSSINNELQMEIAVLRLKLEQAESEITQLKNAQNYMQVDS